MNQKCKVLHTTNMKTGYHKLLDIWLLNIILIKAVIFSVLMYVQKLSLFNSLDDEEENVKDICLNYV